VFALAAKKKTKMAIVTVRLRSGEQAAFQTEKYLPPEIKGKLASVLSHLSQAATRQTAAVAQAVVSQPPALQQAAPVSVADEIRKLAELKDAGILSEEEFVSQKAKLLS
jgi:hypothetical protein